MKDEKTKEIGKKDERMEYKKEITKGKAAKIITNEIISRAKLNQADSYLQKKRKNYRKNKKLFKKSIRNYFQKNSLDTKTMLIILIVQMIFVLSIL